MIFTSSGCRPMPVPYSWLMSIGGSLARWEPGITRSGPLSVVNSLMHHMADSACQVGSVPRSAKT